jgi:lipoprotein-releasing system permease protein
VAIVSALRIMIFEKGRTIGLLKALGATNASVRRIFLIKASRLIAEGILIGDAVALTLCVLQQRLQIVKLDAESYSMSHVPVDIDPWIFLLVSLGTLAACLVALLLPAAYISHISPAKALRIER